MDFWLKATFSLDAVPDWTCPWCRNGVLRLLPDRFRFGPAAPYAFDGVLRCSGCAREPTISGVGRLEHVTLSTSHNESYLEEDRVVFSPTKFRPTFPLFPIDGGWPEALQNALEDCFVSFWIDLAACAAGFRAALGRTLVGAGFGKPAGLRGKLTALKRSRPELAGELLAIRWIARGEAPADRFKVLDALGPMERCFRELAGGPS